MESLDDSSDSEMEGLIADAFDKIQSNNRLTTESASARGTSSCRIPSRDDAHGQEGSGSESDSDNESSELGFVIDRKPVSSTTTGGDDSEDEEEDDSDEDKQSNKKIVKPVYNNQIKLSSEIQSDLTLMNESYLKKTTKQTKSTPSKEMNIQNLIQGSSEDREIMKKSVLKPDIEKNYALPPYQESLRQLKKQRKKEKQKTKGKGWYNMSAPEMTEQTKNDLTVLQMRGALDPKRFYKANDLKALPKFFQFGKVVESPVDFYHARIPKKQRKSTMVDELLADAEFRKYNKRKYGEIQEAKRKGAGPYKHMKRLKNRKR